MAGTQSTVSNLGAPSAPVTGNADTITNSLAPFPSDGAKKAVHDAAETGRIPDYYRKTPGDCGVGSSGPGLQTQLGVATASALAQSAGSAVKIGTKALNAVPVVGPIVSSVLSLITAPFQHHAQAVQNEQNTLCIAVPDANNFLAVVDQYVNSGQWDHVTAVQEMENGFTAWKREVAAILKDTSGQCNAACVYEKAFRAAIEKRKLDYQQIEAQQSSVSKNLPASVVSAVGSVGASVGDFLKKQTGAVESALSTGDVGTILGALVVGFGVVIAFRYVVTLGRDRR